MAEHTNTNIPRHHHFQNNMHNKYFKNSYYSTLYLSKLLTWFSKIKVGWFKCSSTLEWRSIERQSNKWERALPQVFLLDPLFVLPPIPTLPTQRNSDLGVVQQFDNCQIAPWSYTNGHNERHMNTINFTPNHPLLGNSWKGMLSSSPSWCFCGTDYSASTKWWRLLSNSI